MSLDSDAIQLRLLDWCLVRSEVSCNNLLVPTLLAIVLATYLILATLNPGRFMSTFCSIAVYIGEIPQGKVRKMSNARIWTLVP